ncbi:hypothetical protein PHLGIDRAFT_126380 [Phlebiopsis gigantea 11061_1 CR5-6]|uniref:Uncharacterized protein n=1 Tax=Phlebiopsis gigantea (strain 11061_1 CR5-6) TaxID=745531 RepID=A0A0C3PQJ2_PHLG1|nr:hypothetical protein PHLGIDRAFT_126380 [Phlebiopsis gigantea 11061_1 CR5-6]
MSTSAATLLEFVASPGNRSARSDSARSESFADVAQPGAATSFRVSYSPTRTSGRSTNDTKSLASTSSQSTLSLSSPGSPTFISSSQSPVETPLIALQSVGSSTESSADSSSTVSRQFITSSLPPASESTSAPSTPSSVVSASQTDLASTATAQDANPSSSLLIFTASTASDVSGTQLATLSSSADIITSTSQVAPSSPSPTQTASLSSVANSKSVGPTTSTLPSSQSASLSTDASQVPGTSRDIRPTRSPLGTSSLIFISSSRSTSSDSPTPVAAVAGPSETTLPFVQLTTIPVQTTLASNSGTATSGQVGDITQMVGTMPTPAAPSATSERADAAQGRGVTLLVATLVPAILVVLALLVAGLLFVRRIRRNRRAWFMATYEDLTASGDVEYAASSRRSSRYGSAGSVPSAASAHRDMVQRHGTHLPALVEDPFGDPVDVHTPLVGHARAESAARAPTPTSSVGARRGARSPALPSPSPGAKAGRRLSAMSVIGRSPSPLAMSTKAGSRPKSAASVDLTNPREWADMDDPFADPNKRATG